MQEPTEADIPLRGPVWDSLSELFLDTSLDEEDHKRIAAVLGKSAYTLQELEEILQMEVYPVCRGNLFLVAGEWAGFDQEWLYGRILHKRSIFMRAWAASVGRVSVRSSREWHLIKVAVLAQREERRTTTGCNRQGPQGVAPSPSAGGANR